VEVASKRSDEVHSVGEPRLSWTGSSLYDTDSHIDVASTKHADSGVIFPLSPRSHAERSHSDFDLEQLSKQHLDGLEKLIFHVEDSLLSTLPSERRTYISD
jgi:hypothetical protein